MALQESPCVAQRATALRQARIPQMPSMNHVRPDFQRYEDAAIPRLGREAQRIIE
jgi:hypothetical protein